MNEFETGTVSKQNGKYTAATYGTFECKVCGDQGFVPLSPTIQNGDGQTTVELTCSHGHTDSYAPSRITYLASKPAASALKVRRAAVGIG